MVFPEMIEKKMLNLNYLLLFMIFMVFNKGIHP